MLSNTHNAPPPMQKQHRRQKSTPLSAPEQTNVQNVSGPVRAKTGLNHRRGWSHDIRQPALTMAQSTRHDSMVSMDTNNLGLAQSPQFNQLRETQQQRIRARPGRGVQAYHNTPFDPRSMREQFVPFPQGTPSQLYSLPQKHVGNEYDPLKNLSELQAMSDQHARHALRIDHDGWGGVHITRGTDMQALTHSSPQSTPGQATTHESPAGPGWVSDGETTVRGRNSRRISDGIADRVSAYENMVGPEGFCPTTPQTQDANAYLPPTPMETPQDEQGKHAARHGRFAQGYDESMEETLKPNRARPNLRVQDIFQGMPPQSESSTPSVPSPPRSASLPHVSAFPEPDMHSTAYGMPVDPYTAAFQAAEHYDMASNASHHPSPMTPHMMEDFDMHQAIMDPYSQPLVRDRSSKQISRRLSPHRRADSVASAASAASAASISTLNIEDAKTTTGITIEEISRHIKGPEEDGKWVCTYDDCQKRFGRKENIKSHVQTHLNDRQYQCPSCQKCFVRQHDLKRHAKIHSGVKPYPCDCGNTFARHDALTRHRQRGMCIGAFDGIVRKNVKRGRPRKHRPDLEERLDKSAKTRRKNNMSVSSVTSQFSNFTDSSIPSTPDDDLQDLDQMIMDTDDDDFMLPGTSAATFAMSSAPMPTAMTTTFAPEMAASPGDSLHSYVSPGTLMEGPSSNAPPSPARSTASHFNNLPELSQSSSPPPATHFAEPETDPVAFTNAWADPFVTGMTTGMSNTMASMFPDTLREPEEEAFWATFTNNDTSLLDN